MDEIYFFYAELLQSVGCKILILIMVHRFAIHTQASAQTQRQNVCQIQGARVPEDAF